MAAIFDPRINAQMFVNSLAGAHIADSPELRQVENQIAPFRMPVKNDVQFQDPRLAGFSNFIGGLAQGASDAFGRVVTAPEATARDLVTDNVITKKQAKDRAFIEQQFRN